MKDATYRKTFPDLNMELIDSRPDVRFTNYTPRGINAHNLCKETSYIFMRTYLTYRYAHFVS